MPAPAPRAVGRAAVPPNLATPRATLPEVRAIAMGRATVQLPRIPAVGRAKAPPAPRPPADISHPAAVYHFSSRRDPSTDPLPSNAIEDSGSLTGQVLSRGRVDVPGPRSRTVFVVLAIAGVVVVLALFGLTVAAFTSDAVSSLFERITGG